MRRTRWVLAVVVMLVAAGAVWLRTRPKTDAAGGGEETGAGAGAPLAPAALPRVVRVPPPPWPAAARRDQGAPEGALEGRVVARGTEDGIPGASLAFRHAGVITPVSTEADGRFRFAAPSPGRYELVAAEAEGFFPFVPQGGESPIVFHARRGAVVSGAVVQLTRALRLRGRVVDDGGSPVAGAHVEIVAADESLASAAAGYVSDERGELMLEVAAGAAVEARHPELAPGRATVDDRAVAAGVVTVRLGPRAPGKARRAVIAGVVQDHRGAPAASVPVTGFGPRSREEPAPAAVATTDGHGRFVLRELEEGEYTVQAMASRLRLATRAGVPAGTTDLELRLPPATSALLLSVSDARSGAPLTSFVAALAGEREPPWGAPLDSRAVFDSAGELRWPDLAPGVYTAYVSAYDHAPAEKQVRLEEGAEAVLLFELEPGGRLEGRVVDASSRHPVADAAVTTEGAAPGDASALPLRAEARTGADGRFVLAGLAAGLRSVSVTATGYHLRIVSALAVKPGAVTGPIEISLSPLAAAEEPKVELVGIGAVLSLDGEALLVRDVHPAGGAALAGLSAGDRVLAIDGRPVAELGFGDAIEAIRGVPGTTVLLRVARAGASAAVEVRVERRRLRL